MSRKIALPSEQHVQDVAAQMRAEAAASGKRLTVLAIARRLGLSNATFWRHFRDFATEIRQTACAAQAPSSVAALDSAGGGTLAGQNAKLRRERDHLARQLQTALAHLRRLAIDNARLRSDLEAARGITRLNPAAPKRSGHLHGKPAHPG